MVRVAIKHITTIWEIDHKCNSCFFQMFTGTSGTSVCPLLPFNPHLILVQPHPTSCSVGSVCLVPGQNYIIQIFKTSGQLSKVLFFKCAAIFLSYSCFSLYHAATLPLMVTVGWSVFANPQKTYRNMGGGVAS